MNESAPELDPMTSIRDSARALGMELDDAETARWLEDIRAAAAALPGDDVVVDESGVFGHRISMLDFSPRELARFRRIGEVVELTGPPGVVEGALALSGSAAQSKIQTHPGDADFFQRLNVIADTREEACRILAGLVRDKAMGSPRGQGHQFIEAKWSSYPYDAVRDGAPVSKGGPIAWRLDDITAGSIEVTVDGEPRTLDWDELAIDPGWVKVDYVVVDPSRHRLCNASNVVDVSWQGPDGEIVALDGYLDAYFQEVYLDAEALPVFTKVVRHVSGDALDEYVEQLEGEVRKYLTGHVNYGKAAKRMYNVFRLTGRHLDAAFVRELFDEPTTFLYQVWSLIGTLDNATSEDSGIPIEEVRLQADELILKVVELLDGIAEMEIVSALLELKHSLEGPDVNLRSREVEAAKEHVINLINTFFHDRLVVVPTIKSYMESLATPPAP
ncbi:MAG: hypothetical protein JWO46_1131 [Nocardioidaceae bacterium]|nr:hypothetical protein [Nocardioidaceae bacterium]